MSFKGEVATEEAAAFAAGAVGSSLGTAAAVLGTSALVAAGVIAAPATLTILAIGLLGGVIGGYAFSEASRAGVRRVQGR